MEPGEPCRQVEDADARHHQREGFPHPLYAGHRRLHRAPAPRRAVAIASLSRRESLGAEGRSEEHTSELQSLMRISYAVFCLKKKKTNKPTNIVVTISTVCKLH